MSHVILRTPADFGALIRERRRALGLGQSELAERIGVSRLWVNQVERGKPGAGLGLILRALADLDVELRAETRSSDARAADAAPVVTPDINAIVAGARRKHPK